MNGRILAVGAGLAAMVLAGCGGSSSNGGTSGGTGIGTEATTVTVQFTRAMPTAVATKVGSGAFTAVTPAATVTLEVPSGTTDFSVAYVCPEVALTVGLNTVESSGERVLNATVADGTSYTEQCAMGASNGTTGALTASVDASALGATNILLRASNGSATANTSLLGDVDSNVSMLAPAGNDWVGVLAYSSPVLGNTGPLAPMLMGAKFFENQAVPGALNGGEPVVLTAADATTPEPLTFSNVPAGYGTPLAQVSFMPSGQKTSVLMTTGATASYPAMPAALARSGDTYRVIALANTGAGSSQSTGSVEQIVSVQQTFTAPGPVSMSFPAAWGYTGPAPAALPAFEFNYAGFSGASNVNRVGTITWAGADQAGVSIGVTCTAAYGGGSAAVSIPDLSGLEGFIAKPASGTMVTWIAAVESGGSSSASGSSGPAGSPSTQLVESMGTFVVP